MKEDSQKKIDPSVIKKVLVDKHSKNISAETFKLLPRAITDPLMIFKTKDENKFVAVLELKDQTGATVIAPVELEKKDPFHGVAISLIQLTERRKTVYQVIRGLTLMSMPAT